MSTSRTSELNDGFGASVTPAPTAELPVAEPPTDQLLSGPIGDRCANCDATLAADQRYCLNCGERRGRTRFAAGSAPVPSGSVTTTTTTVAEPVVARRNSAGITLIAGIATLILAMGVGVLIGQNNNAPVTQTRAAAPQVIVNGGGNGSSGSGSAGSSAASTGTVKHAKPVKVIKTEKAKAAKAAAAAKPTAAAVQKAGNAAAKVTGGNNTQKPTVQPGQQCASGTPGCTNGKFTGTFFGQ
jgi:hypothetical protein